MQWKKYKKPLLGGVVLAVVLLLAFYVGGNSPDSRGWTADEPAAQATAETAPAAQEEPSQEEEPAAEETEPEEAADKNEEPQKTAPAVKSPASKKPAPAKPRPEQPTEPEKKPAPPAKQEPTCTISISCSTILANLDRCDPAKRSLVPADGWLLKEETVTFSQGESVFDVVQRVCREKKIHMEYNDTPVYGSAYMEGIGNLYEFDVGELSGWMYQVNGVFPNYGCSQYAVQPGDAIRWVYTCNQGDDVGGGAAAD